MVAPGIRGSLHAVARRAAIPRRYPLSMAWSGRHHGLSRRPPGSVPGRFRAWATRGSHRAPPHPMTGQNACPGPDRRRGPAGTGPHRDGEAGGPPARSARTRPDRSKIRPARGLASDAKSADRRSPASSSAAKPERPVAGARTPGVTTCGPARPLASSPPRPGRPRPGRLRPGRPRLGRLRPGRPRLGRLRLGRPRLSCPPPGRPRLGLPGRPRPGLRPGRLPPGLRAGRLRPGRAGAIMAGSACVAGGSCSPWPRCSRSAWRRA
jgi:hypothetical protein